MAESLAIPPRAGFHRHWFNLFGNRGEVALALGWMHVVDESGKDVVRCVGITRGCDPLYAACMEIEQERYDQLISTGGVLGPRTEQIEAMSTLPRSRRYGPADPRSPDFIPAAASTGPLAIGLPEGQCIVAIAQGPAGQVIVATTTMVWRLVDDHLEPIEFRPTPA